MYRITKGLHMLIETPYKSNDTITIKLTSGEEIVGRFVKEDDKKLTIKKPLTLMATQQGFGLGPYAITISPDSEIALNKTAIVFSVKTETEMAKQYMTSTTGIQL